MGTFEVDVTVANANAPQRSGKIRLLVDTGATLSWLPRDFLKRLEVEPLGHSRFILADGSEVERETGMALFTVDGKSSPCVFAVAERGESSVLGATSLEILGFAVDPIEQKLVDRKLLALRFPNP